MGGIYAAAAGVLIVAVLAVAYGTTAPSLGVAEFAPAARSQVESPPTTNPPGASGDAGTGVRRTTTTTAPPASATTAPNGGAVAPTTQVGRSRQCYGNPPRQTDDPMSPPCIATIFEADNGGATSRGVSSTEIRVAVPVWSSRGNGPAYAATVTALFEYFNTRFELYGRRLVPVTILGDAGSSTAARAHAADIAAQNVFASLNANHDWGYPQATLPQTLAHEGVISIVSNQSAWWTDRTVFDASHPYIWSVYPSSEDIQANLAAFACTSLAGQPARFAGDAALRTQSRQFAIVAVGQQMPPATRALSEALTACTGQRPVLVEWTTAQGSTTLQTSMSRARSEGATTLICVCESVHGSSVAPAAHQAGYHPEWILTPSPAYGNNDDELQVQSTRASSAAFPPPLRLSAGPRLIPMQARPWFQALQTVNPTLGQNPSDTLSVWALAGSFYEQLLVLAAGVQGAGPRLDTGSFAAALMSMQFPNPGAGAAPYWQPSAGFGAGDHSFFDDYSVGWWSDTVEAMNSPVSRATGSWCYVGQGARFRPGIYPGADANVLFNADLPCR